MTRRQSVANLSADGDLARALAEVDMAPVIRREPSAEFEVPELPPPILAHVLCYLHSPRALCNARQVSRHWCEVASFEELWRALYFALCGQTRHCDRCAINQVSVEGGWRRRTVLAWRLSRPRAVSIRPVWGGLDGRLFGAPRSGHAAAVYRPREDAPEHCMLIGGATTNYAYRRDADIFLPAAAGEEMETENCLSRLPAPPIDATNVLDAWSPRWLHTAVVVHTPCRSEAVSSHGSVGTDSTLPERSPVLLLIGGQQQRHVHTEVHRLELSTGGDATITRGMRLSEAACFAPERWNQLDRTSHFVGGWAGHSATVHNQDQVILFGGLHQDGLRPSNRLCRLNAAAGEFMPVVADGTAPCPRWCHSAAMLSNGVAESDSKAGELLAIFGGWRYPQSIFLNDMHLLSLDTTSDVQSDPCPSLWTRVKTFGIPPVPRCQSSMTVLDGGILLVFGGACHAIDHMTPYEDSNCDNVAESETEQEHEHEEDDEEEDSVAYGDHVVDLPDVQLFDLKTQTWLRCESSYAPLRGGVNTMFRIGRTVYISGGMHSDPGATMPIWTGELAQFAAVLPAVEKWQRELHPLVDVKAGGGSVTPKSNNLK